MRLRLLAVFVALVVAAPASAADDYAKEVQKAIKKVLSVDFRKYQFFGTPLSNFGCGTLYPRAASDATFDVTTAGLFGDPNTWWEPGIPASEVQLRLDTVRPSGQTGALALSDISKKKFSLSAVVPELLGVLGVNAGFDWERNVTVTITADAAVNHRLNWSGLAALIEAKPRLINAQVLAHLQKPDDLMITIGDIVLENFKVHIAVNRKMDATAKATFTNAVSALSKDTKAAFAYNSTGEGSLDLVSKRPVIVAHYTAPPPPGALALMALTSNATRTVIDPTPVKFTAPVIKGLETAATKKAIIVK